MSVVKIPDAAGETITLVEHEGHYLPNLPLEAIKGIRDVTIRDDDIFLASYAKCGTHWVWEMARLLLEGSTESDPCKRSKGEGMLEFVPNVDLEKMPSPRILNSHVLPEQLPKDVFQKKIKIIYVVRNPKDMAVSFFHHTKKLNRFYEYNGTWENYLDLLMKGKLDYGSYFAYVKRWEALKAEQPDLPILSLVYEDLKEDPLKGIKTMAKFLGVERSEEFCKKVQDLTSFSTMKTAVERDPKHVGTIIFRKGEVGDWKNQFTVAQNEKFDQLCKEELGTHWVWEIVRLLVEGSTASNPGQTNKGKLMLDFVPNDFLEKVPSPRILNCHLLPEQLPKGVVEKKIKIIHLVRNPEDVVVSFYHHTKKFKDYGYQGTWENYLGLFSEGKVDYGSYFTYLTCWDTLKKNHPELPVLNLMYEDLKENQLQGIKTLAKFLEVERCEEFYRKVQDLTSFSTMKAAVEQHPGDYQHIMYRKGVVGDWKNHFTVAQSERFDKLCQQKLADTDIKFQYTLP